MIDPHKYIVFNRQQFEQVMAHSGLAVRQLEELEDAVVIRLRDVFAATALSSYAHGILCSIEIAKSPRALDTDFLLELADYFAGQADEASRLQNKVPD